MDLTTAISDFQQGRIVSQVQVKVARKVLDVQEMQGAAAIRLIEAAGKIATGGDERPVAAATGLGGAIDTYG